MLEAEINVSAVLISPETSLCGLQMAGCPLIVSLQVISVYDQVSGVTLFPNLLFL